jgi:hypothetical protein
MTISKSVRIPPLRIWTLAEALVTERIVLAGNVKEKDPSFASPAPRRRRR